MDVKLSHFRHIRKTKVDTQHLSSKGQKMNKLIKNINNWKAIRCREEKRNVPL